jgi:hypothetical protein
MKFKEVYKAVINKRESELNRTEMMAAVSRQIENVAQQRKALNACTFGRKRTSSGKGSSFTTMETHGAKYGPWMTHLETDRVISKFETLYQLHEKLSIVKKRLGIE